MLSETFLALTMDPRCRNHRFTDNSLKEISLICRQQRYVTIPTAARAAMTRSAQTCLVKRKAGSNRNAREQAVVYGIRPVRMRDMEEKEGEGKFTEHSKRRWRRHSQPLQIWGTALLSRNVIRLTTDLRPTILNICWQASR